MQKGKRAVIINAVVLAVIFGITVFSITRENNFSHLPDAFRMANKPLLITGLVLALLYVACESFILIHMFRKEGRRVGLVKCLKYSAIGFFVSAVTPSATGGQPVEILYMKRDGIPVSSSAPMLMCTTILYKIVLVTTGLLFMFAGYGMISPQVSNAWFLFWLGFALNSAFIVVIILLLFYPRVLERFAGWLFSLKVFRRHEKPREVFLCFCRKYAETCDFLRGKRRDVALWMAVSFFQRAVLLYINYLVYRAFGLSGYTAWQIMLLQGVIAICADMLPLPGGIGISEHLFLSLYAPVFGEGLILPAMILSRFITFYWPLILSGIVFLIAHFAKAEPASLDSD